MKIHRTTPNESTQFQADAPGIRAMRMIMPIAALLSAVSLAGGIASFFEVGLTTTAGICLTIAFAVAAWQFDSTAVQSGQSVVRDSILAWQGEIDKDLLFFINLIFAALICAAMVTGSFIASRNGISHLVLEARKAKEIRTATDTILTQTITGATDQNGEMLEAHRSAYEAQVSAVNAQYAGKIESLQAEIERREKQRHADNTLYIDQRITRLKKQIGETKSEQGKELSALATSFAAKQARILTGNEKLQSIVLDDAKAAADRRKDQQTEKDEMDRRLSGLVAAIFSWSVILMLIIGLRLTILETRNGILPNPITTNSDLSGSTMLLRFILSVPNFIFACLTWLSERLYQLAPKKPVPVVDSDVIDFKAAQLEVTAVRKEGKVRKLAAAERREIGYKQAGMTAPNDGNMTPKMTAINTGSNDGNNGPVSTAPQNGENDGEKEVIIQRVDSMIRDCVECGESYRARAHNQRFCSRSCKTAHHTNNNGGRAFDPAKYHGKKF